MRRARKIAAARPAIELHQRERQQQQSADAEAQGRKRDRVGGRDDITRDADRQTAERRVERRRQDADDLSHCLAPNGR
jgi:hypothetical protein